MRARHGVCWMLVAGLPLLAGCHHHAVARSVVVPPPPLPSAGPVMVSVPPPTHRSVDARGDIATSSDIPVVKPVHPPKKQPRRSAPVTPPVVAVNQPPVSNPPPPAPSTGTSPAASLSLGQLTSGMDDPSTTRDGAAQAIRRERDRIGAIPGPVQTTHATEIEQARRFLRSASDSWNASDYAGTIALTTKARVILDDLLK